jgi:proline iminopeptidase
MLRGACALIASAMLTTSCGPRDLSPSSPVSEGTVAMSDGMHIKYRTYGAGSDTVVVVHGGPGLHMRYLVRRFAPLTKGHVLLFYDQRGRGESDPPRSDADWALDRDARDLRELFDHFKLQHAAVIADGAGAWPVTRFMIENGLRVSRLAILTPPQTSMAQNGLFALGYGDQTRFEKYLAAMGAGHDSTDTLPFCRDYWFSYLSPARVGDSTVIARGAADVCDAAPAVLRRAQKVIPPYFSSIGDRDFATDMKSITSPTLLIWGTQVPFYNDIAGIWRTQIPESRKFTVEGWPQFPWLHHEAAVFDALSTFLSGRFPAGAT